jgi:hypothetical protein
VSVSVADVVGVEDVGVRRRRGGLRLPFEPAQTLGIRRELRRPHLDRDVAAQPRVPGAMDLAYAARADEADDLLGTEAIARARPVIASIAIMHYCDNQVLRA